MTRRLAIAMPVEGDPATARVCYAVQVQQRMLRELVKLDEYGATWADGVTGNVDVSRARDRLARVVLTDPRYAEVTDVLWWDEDVLPDDPRVIGNLLATGYDVVGIPYPRKRYPAQFPFRLAGPDGETRAVTIERDCIEVDGLSFGFTLTSRSALQAMWDAYEGDRWYIDVDQVRRTHARQVGMFELQYTAERPGPDGAPFREKLSEDYSFCQSYRAIGGRVHMYIGPGAPVGHIGSHVYKGRIDDIVRT